MYISIKALSIERITHMLNTTQATSLIQEIQRFSPCDDLETTLDYMLLDSIDQELESRAIDATIHEFDINYCQ